MIELQDIAEILLVEDNPNDVELTIRALKKKSFIQQNHSTFRRRRSS